MGWRSTIRSLPLRGKLALTLAGTTVVLVGVATILSFRYWEREALRASEGQSLLAAAATRATLESALRTGSEGVLRRHLVQLLEDGPTVAARVYDRDGRILYSADPREEGRVEASVWVPNPALLPRSGVAHPDASGGVVRVFVPLATSTAAILEIDTSVAPLQSAMRRGALLGLALTLGSLVVVALIVAAMLETEVVTPLHRVEDTLASRTGERPTGDELRTIRRSVDRLLEREDAAEAEVRRTEGFAEVGQLAAEMAHEFKRPLASIRSALDMLDQEYHLDGGGRATMTAVNEQILRLSETMEDLFSLARPVEVRGEEVRLDEVMDDALVEFAGQPGAGRVRVERDYAPDVPPTRGDARRLRQALANLMVNALEAMPEGGTLSLRIRRTAEGCVEISISDTGQGIPPDHVEQVLLPFYSTKPRGTGLGLPLVARVISAHQGSLDVSSAPGEGTTIRIRLPALEAGEGEAPEVTPCLESTSSS